MATANVARKNNASNASNATTASKASGNGKAARNGKQSKVNLVELAAAAWGFANKVAGENFDRDALHEGGQYQVKMHMAAEIDGQLYQSNFEGQVNVGHDSVRASSVGAKAGEVIAYLLSKVNAATREKTLAEMADVFAANGGKLPVSEESVAEADEAMKKLRQKVDQPVRGSVRVNYAPAQPSLGIVGRD